MRRFFSAAKLRARRIQRCVVLSNKSRLLAQKLTLLCVRRKFAVYFCCESYSENACSGGEIAKNLPAR